MKHTLLLSLTILFASCATGQYQQLERMEELLLSQNEVLIQLEQDIAHLENNNEQGELTSNSESALNETISIDYSLDNKIVVGDKEMIYLNPPGEYFMARIDTGATTSSVHGSDIVWFERDGKKWVRFNMNHDGKERVIEKPVVEVRTIRQSSSPEPIERAVIKMISSIGGIETEVDYTLADRSHMTFPLLIGRNLLKDLMVVDVALEYIHKMPAEQP